MWCMLTLDSVSEVGHFDSLPHLLSQFSSDWLFLGNKFTQAHSKSCVSELT